MSIEQHQSPSGIGRFPVRRTPCYTLRFSSKIKYDVPGITTKKIVSRALRAFLPVKTDPHISGIHIRGLKRDYELVGA
jgi:hypothetical protein